MTERRVPEPGGPAPYPRRAPEHEGGAPHPGRSAEREGGAAFPSRGAEREAGVPYQRRGPGPAGRADRGRALDRENPDRLYTITGGRAHAGSAAFDTVTLIVAEADPRPGMQSEHAKILRMARRPVAVVEISARLGLPVSVVKILLCDLLDSGRITARHPVAARTQVPDVATLEQVLIGLRNL